MGRYVVRRLGYLLPLWLALSVVAFAVGSLTPGDVARDILRQRLDHPPSSEELEVFRAELGLDEPLYVRYADWLTDAVAGDLGVSIWSGQDVTGLLLQSLPTTTYLALLAFLFAVVIGIPLGVLAALRPGGVVDQSCRVLALSGASLPSYWIGYVLITIFAVWLGFLPSQGAQGPTHFVLPAVTLALGPAGMLLRLTRVSMLEVLGEEFLLAGRSRGLSRGVLVRQAIRVAMNPVLTSAGLIVGFLLAGAVIVETVFAMPGVGRTLVDAANHRDVPIIQGFVLYVGTLVIVVNLAVDLLYVALDPRVRLIDDAKVTAGE